MKEHVVQAYWREFGSNLQAAYQENSEIRDEQEIISFCDWDGLIGVLYIVDFIVLCMECVLVFFFFVLAKLQFDVIQYLSYIGWC